MKSIFLKDLEPAVCFALQYPLVILKFNLGGKGGVLMIVTAQDLFY